MVGVGTRLMAPPVPESSLQRRVVLVGASNVARGIATAVASIRQHLGTRLDILIACGHGRSYGLTSSMLGRSLPGIAECGLWNALRQRPVLPTFALLTDIGNDLLYNVPVPRIAGWVEICLQRLSAINTRIILTELPLANLTTLPLWRFRLLRTLFFPGRNRAFADVVSDAKALNERIQNMAQRYAARLLKPHENWYGFDPIHIEMQQWPQAWRTLTAAWASDGASDTPARGSLADWFYLRWLCPEQRVLFGIHQSAAQPVGKLYDDTRISVY